MSKLQFVINQKIQGGKESICQSCAHRFVCRAYDNQPCVECNHFLTVVRCKDCKYRQDDDFCGGRGWPAQLVPDDGYCDRGARTDGGSE